MRLNGDTLEADLAAQAMCKVIHGEFNCACAQRGKGRCDSLDATVRRLGTALRLPTEKIITNLAKKDGRKRR